MTKLPEVQGALAATCNSYHLSKHFFVLINGFVWYHV